MSMIAFPAPILPGKKEQWDRFIGELRGPRRADFEAANRRAGVRERTFLQQGPDGTQLVIVTLEGDHSETAKLRAANEDTEQPGTGLVRSRAMREQRDPGSLYMIVEFESEEKARARERDPRRLPQVLPRKGKAKPVPAYIALGVRAERWEDGERAGHARPLIGREQELAIILNAWRSVQDGAGQLLTILGEPGVGRSTALAGAGLCRTDRTFRSAPFWSGQRMARSSRTPPSWSPRDGEVVVLFEPRSDLVGWSACSRGRPDLRILPKVRQLPVVRDLPVEDRG